MKLDHLKIEKCRGSFKTPPAAGREPSRGVWVGFERAAVVIHVDVSSRRGEEGVRSGGPKTERLRVIDWEHPANHDFQLVSQFSVTGARYTGRPDLGGFGNDLPVVVLELKKSRVPAGARRSTRTSRTTSSKYRLPSPRKPPGRCVCKRR